MKRSCLIILFLMAMLVNNNMAHGKRNLNFPSGFELAMTEAEVYSVLKANNLNKSIIWGGYEKCYVLPEPHCIGPLCFKMISFEYKESYLYAIKLWIRLPDEKGGIKKEKRNEFKKYIIDHYDLRDMDFKISYVNIKIHSEKAANLAKKKRAKEYKRFRMKKFNELKQKFRAKDAQRILDQKVWIGMNQEQLILSWGEPDDKNRTVTKYGIREQWIYGEFPNVTYVYLEDGVVTSWQD